MTDPRDRVLEYALRRVYRAGEDAEEAARDVERPRAIARAWQRGVRGSGVVDLPAPEPIDAPLRRRARLRALPVAASILALFLAAGWWLRGAEDAHPVLASRPIAFLEHERWIVDGGTRFGPGDTLWVPRGEPVELVFEGGGRVELAGETLARLSHHAGRPRVELEWGSVTAESGEGPGPSLLAGGVALTLEPETQLRASLRFDRRRPTPTAFASFTALESRLAAQPLGLLRLAVDRGQARAQVAGGELDLARGEEVALALGAGPAQVLQRDELASCEELLDALGQEGWYDLGLVRELDRSLRDRAELWLLFEERISVELAQDKILGGWPDALLTAMALDSTRTSLRIARTLWMERPEAFGQDHVVAFAERGAFEFEREVRGVIKWYDEPRSGDPGELVDPLPCALYLAERGDAFGVGHLLQAVAILDEEVTAKGWNPVLDALVAALSLTVLGERDPWPAAVKRAVELCRGALEEGAVEVAAMGALAIEQVVEMHERPAPRRVSFRELRMLEHFERRRDALTTPDEVERLLLDLLERAK